MSKIKNSLAGTFTAISIGSSAYADLCYTQSMEAFEYSRFIYHLISRASEDANQYGYMKPNLDNIMTDTLKSLSEFSNQPYRREVFNHTYPESIDSFTETACSYLINLIDPDTKLDRDFMINVINPVLAAHIDPHTQYIKQTLEEDFNDNTITVSSSNPSDYVESRILDDGTAYLKLNEFVEGVASVLKSHIETMLNTDTPPSQFILDLRDNPGDSKREYERIADLFIDGYTVIHDDGLDIDNPRNRDAVFSESYYPDDIIDDRPLKILINEKSASASEYLAGTLQHHYRASVFGVNSQGKGTGYSITFMQYYALTLTTESFPLIAGTHTHQGYGITPNVRVTSYEIPDDTFYERDYSNMIDLSHIPLQYPENVEYCDIVASDPILACALQYRLTP